MISQFRSCLEVEINFDVGVDENIEEHSPPPYHSNIPLNI